MEPRQVFRFLWVVIPRLVHDTAGETHSSSLSPHQDMTSIPFPTRHAPDETFRKSQGPGGAQWPLLFKLVIAGCLAAGLAVAAGSLARQRRASETQAASFAQPLQRGSQVHIYTPHKGVILERYVSEGQQVAKGETLYVLFSDAESGAQGTRHHAISERLRRRLARLREDMVLTHNAQAVEIDELRRKIHDTRTKLSWMNVQWKQQKSVVENAVDAAGRHAQLQDGRFGQLAAQAAREHLREQQARLQVIETRHSDLEKALVTHKRTLHALPLKQANALAHIQRAMSNTSNELSQSDARRRVVVAAPQAGVATGVVAQVGQQVDDAQPLLGMTPLESSTAEQVCATPPPAVERCT
jgi:membrane fusion protein